MISLTYVSSALHFFKTNELVQLLHRCRENNARLHVTGMLLYKEGNFMQVLEGAPANVRKVFRTIAADPRHSGVVKLAEEDMEFRVFKEWPMAFCNLDKMDPSSISGYAAFADVSLISPVFQKDPSRAQQLMLALRSRL